MLLRHCCPTLLALSLSAGCLLGSAMGSALGAAETDGRRDEHARAIRALIDLGAKIPAERQIGIWAQSGYADIAPSLKQALQDAYDQTFEPTFDGTRMAKYEAKGLPPVIADVTGRGSGIEAIVKMLNETRKALDPDAPKPTVTPSEEKILALQRTFTRLAGSLDREFAVAIELVKAHHKDEENVWELDERRDAKKIADIQFQAVIRRIDALKIFYFAHMALREAALRGADFGLDPKVYNDALVAFSKQYYETIQEWDFQWAEMHPQLQLFCAIAVGEAVRSKMKGSSESDAEAAFLRIIDLDMEAVPPGAREAVRTVKANAWANVLRWRLELATPASYDRGIGLYNDFLKRLGKDKAFSLDYTDDNERAIAVGQIHITAGRLFAAKGDSASASNAWARVQGSKNPLGFGARQWLSGGSDIAADWGQEPLPADPTLALTVGRALIAEARTANPAQARSYYLKAALGLRGGVLGLGSSAFESQFVANGPDVYSTYAYALDKLNMPYHAATAAFEGLRQAESRLDSKKNPWRDSKGAWTKDGEKLQRLLSTALSYTSKLNAQGRSAATKRLFDSAVELAQKVDPEAVGKNLIWMLVATAFNDREYEQAIEGARDYVKKYPEDFVKSASLMLRAQQALVNKLAADTSASGKAKLSQEQKSLDETVAKLEGWLAKQPAEAVAGVKPLRVAVISARIQTKLKSGDYDGVFTDLGPEFWAGGRVDSDLAETMLKYLAQAVHEAHLKLSGMVDANKDKPKPVDAPALVAAWQRYEPVLKLWRKQKDRYFAEDPTPLKNSSYRLANVAQIATSQAERIAREPGISAVSEAARLAFADFIEPFVDESSRPALILAIAQTLWDIGEKARAVRLFELYKTSLDNDEMVIAYRADPQVMLATFKPIFSERQETREIWKDIEDLLYDPPGFLKDLVQLGAGDMRSKGQRRDYQNAIAKIDALRKVIEGQGFLDADTKASLLATAAKLRQMTANLAYTINIDSNLAQYYRETNQATRAVALYRALYQDYDPLNPQFAEGYVEGVLQALSSGEVLGKEVITQAREVAGRNLRFFERRPQDRDSYWMSYLQVFELTKYLGGDEKSAIKKSLEFTIRNKSTPRHDLLAPALPGDDPGIGRPRHALAVAIAQRFLDLFDEVGVANPFRIEQVQAGGKSMPIFVDTAVPAVEAVIETDADGDEKITIKRVAVAEVGEGKP